MTFSDQRVVDLIRANFVPAWESVAPVSIVTFELGGGKSVRGTMSGEIAIYFCRPDGKVFDILPALHSPQVTFDAIREALAFYEKTGATDEAVASYHREKHADMVAASLGLATPAMERMKRHRTAKRKSADGGTRALAEMGMSKTVMIHPEPMIVVEPGGYALFKRQIHEAMSKGPTRPPALWKEQVFEKILDQPLVGGEEHYDINSLAPISIIEE